MCLLISKFFIITDYHFHEIAKGYGIIVGVSEIETDNWDNNGFGGIWFTTLLFSVSYIIYIYYDKLSPMISKLLKNNLDSNSVSNFWI